MGWHGGITTALALALGVCILPSFDSFGSCIILSALGTRVKVLLAWRRKDRGLEHVRVRHRTSRSVALGWHLAGLGKGRGNLAFTQADLTCFIPLFTTTREKMTWGMICRIVPNRSNYQLAENRWRFFSLDDRYLITAQTNSYHEV